MRPVVDSPASGTSMVRKMEVSGGEDAPATAGEDAGATLRGLTPNRIRV